MGMMRAVGKTIRTTGMLGLMATLTMMSLNKNKQ
jgi:hypothetical protein